MRPNRSTAVRSPAASCPIGSNSPRSSCSWCSGVRLSSQSGARSSPVASWSSHSIRPSTERNCAYHWDARSSAMASSYEAASCHGCHCAPLTALSACNTSQKGTSRRCSATDADLVSAGAETEIDVPSFSDNWLVTSCKLPVVVSDMGRWSRAAHRLALRGAQCSQKNPQGRRNVCSVHSLAWRRSEPTGMEFWGGSSVSRRIKPVPPGTNSRPTRVSHEPPLAPTREGGTQPKHGHVR